MQSLAERQSGFTAALLDPARAVPAGLSARPGVSISDRFSVYRNNVAVGLIEALRSAFPVVDRLVGAEFFSAMARAYSLETLPATPVLLAYGGGFPDFVARFPDAAALPYLPEVAALEWMWLEAYHSLDAPPLSIADLGRVPSGLWPELRLNIHPAARFGRFQHSPLAIWTAHQEQEQLRDISLGGSMERLLVTRPDLQVSIVEVTQGALSLLDRLLRGGTIAEAVADAIDADPEANIQSDLSLLFQAGTFSDFKRGEDVERGGQP